MIKSIEVHVLFKLYRFKACAFIVLTLLVLVIIFPETGLIAKTETLNNDWTAHTLFYAHPVAAQGPAPLTPTQIITAYDLTSTTNGAGTTIAIVDAYDAPTISSDLDYFSTHFNLPNATFIEYKMSDNIQINGTWALETSLDVEWAHAIAPYATILLVEANSSSIDDLIAAVNYATSFSQAGVPPVKAVSMSWGSGEFPAETNYDLSFTSTAINPEIVFFAASGDSGAGVIWPSSSPNVVSVGGTSLNVTSTGTLISETAWSGSGGGVSDYESQPAYQTNYGLTYANRACPDVSFDADPNTGVYVYDSTPYKGNNGWWIVGGTSFGAPSWAAIQALGLSTGNSNFYDDAATTYSSYFRDITTGSNGYPAGIGYDLVTGLGSPVTNNFSPPTAPDFSITVSPPNPIIIKAGFSSTSTITITSLNQFSDPVQLSSTTSSGINPSLSITSITDFPGTSTLTVQVPTNTAPGNYSVTVTGVSGSISHSLTITVQVLSNTSVAVLPSSITMDVGQGQTFTASASGGLSPYTYQWYLNDSHVGTNSTSYTFNPSSAGSFSLYVKVTDSYGVPETAESNTATITVNSALVAPSASASSGTIDQGQTSTLSVSGLLGGTTPYSYQWLQKAPGAGSYSSINGATLSSYSFFTPSSTATGSWSFELRVTDSASTPFAVLSTAASVTVNAVPTVSVTPVGPLTMNVGQVQVFTAAASGGTGSLSYQWYLNSNPVGTNSSTYSFSQAASSYAVTCKVTDSLSMQVTSNAVSITVNQLAITVIQGANGVIVPGTTNVNYGGSQAFTITPNTGYHIAEVDANGSSVGTVTSYTLSNVTGNTTVTASFAINTYSLSVTVGAHGQSNIASQTVNWGSVENFVFTPDAGYIVADVLVNGTVDEGAATSLSLTITGPTSVSVSFANDRYTITVTQTANGLISPGTIAVALGDTPSFSITPNLGYHIASITANGVPVSVTSSSAQTYQFDAVSADCSLTATFAINTYTITVTSAYGNPTTSASVNAGDSFAASVTSPESAGVGQRWICTGYSIDGGSVVSGTSYTFTNIQSNHTITFNWQKQYFLTVQNGGYGVASGSGWFNAGSSPTFSISPTTISGAIGVQYVFDVWSGDSSSTSASASILMSGPMTVTATWTTQYAVSFSQTGVGSDAGTNSVLTLGGVVYAWNTLPSNVWVDSGTIFSWSSPVEGSTGEQFVYNGDLGLTSPITGSGTDTATYATQYLVTFVVSPSGSGATSPSGTNVWENAGSLSITATTNNAYTFNSWSSNTGSIIFNNANSASSTATISGTGTITATFAINTYIITVTQTANGVIAPGTTTVNYGNSRSFTITPNAGYSIASLTVDGSQVAVVSSYAFSNVQAAHTITATFVLTPTLTPTPSPTPSPTSTSASTPASIISSPSLSPTPSTPTPPTAPLYLMLAVVITVVVLILISVLITIRRSRH